MRHLKVTGRVVWAAVAAGAWGLLLQGDVAMLAHVPAPVAAVVAVLGVLAPRGIPRRDWWRAATTACLSAAAVLSVTTWGLWKSVDVDEAEPAFVGVVGAAASLVLAIGVSLLAATPAGRVSATTGSQS